jgi:predicted metal-dependent phosphoesterase TrpH
VLKVELHAHTADDPLDRIPYTTRQLIDHIASLGYDALAVTLHDRQLDVAPLRSYADARGVTLIPGIERTIEGRHVLLLNFRRGAEDVRTFEDLRRLRAREPGLVVAPHPFFPGSSCLGALLERHADLFDAVEYNAMFVRGVNFNRAAVRWAAAHGKPVVGNGDVHRLVQAGRTWSLVDAPPDAEAICDAIRAGRVQAHATPLSPFTAAHVMAGLLLPDLLQMAGPLRGTRPTYGM